MDSRFKRTEALELYIPTPTDHDSEVSRIPILYSGPHHSFSFGGLEVKCYLSRTLLVTTSAKAKRSSRPSRYHYRVLAQVRSAVQFRFNEARVRQIHNFHKHAVLITPSLECVVYHRDPRFEGDGWQWSSCKLCTRTFRLPIQRQGRLPAFGFDRISLLHLHQAASVSEKDGVGYSFSLRADSGEIQDGRARALRRV